MASKNIMESDAPSVKLQYKANSLICLSILPSHQSCREAQSDADFDEYPNLTNRAPSCQQRFTYQQAVTLAEADQTPYILSSQSHHEPAPWDRPPCTFLTAGTPTCFAAPEILRAMIRPWNAAHTSTKKLPKLLQKGMGGMKS